VLATRSEFVNYNDVDQKESYSKHWRKLLISEWKEESEEEEEEEIGRKREVDKEGS
jgi:hypothetical protein